MDNLFCPTHPLTRLIYALRGGAGYCVQCRLYVQAAGVLMPKPTKATGKARTTRSARKIGKVQAR